MSKALSTCVNGDVTIVELLGTSLSGLSDLDPLRQELDELISNKQPSCLLINFKNVKFINSDAIGILIARRKALVAQGGEMKMCEMNPTIRLSFKALNLDGTLFEILDSEEEGISAF